MEGSFVVAIDDGGGTLLCAFAANAESLVSGPLTLSSRTGDGVKCARSKDTYGIYLEQISRLSLVSSRCVIRKLE